MTPLTHSQRTAFNASGTSAHLAQPKRITLVTQNRSIRVSVEEIVWLEGAGNYTFIHTRDRRRYLMAKTLKMFEQELDGAPLARIHKSHVVNLAHVRNIDFGDNACVEMTGGKMLTIARRRVSPTLNQYLQHQQITSDLN
ncbi:LytR/AlgR family response regulator transcription factor [Spirosoma sp.]|uniref:LytR/AlgR family response regulator transcription factor n=1 Tax=Spirosoma sp. TaxID=1899569 RepID=UPI003B3BB85F